MSEVKNFGVQRGQVWQMGAHRLMCGDATNKIDVLKLMANECASIVVTSPPYADCRDYTVKILCWDSLMDAAFDAAIVAPDAQLLVNLGVIHRKNEWVPYWWQWAQSMRAKGWRHYGMYVWDKTMSTPGKFYGRLRPSYENILHFNKSTICANAWVPNKWANHKSKVGPIASGVKQRDGKAALRRPRSVTRSHAEPLSVINLTAVKSSREATGHPAQMPISLAAYILKTWHSRKSRAYDPFCGSETTLIAAEQTDRVGYGMEIAPEYCEMALQRWAKAYPNQVPEQVA